MKSRVQKKETRWEKLDNTANLFPVIANETMTNVYRIAVILSENIEPECLQEALEQVLPWFNTMNVRMRTGMFWYYFETNVKGKPVVREEEDFPCRYIEQHRNKSYLFRVTYYKNRINLEVFHALADGMGQIAKAVGAFLAFAFLIVFLPLFQPLELVLFLKKLSFSLFFFGSKLVEGFRFCHVS